MALLAGLAAPARAADISGTLGVPESITALGDSITAGVHVNRLLLTEPAYSWSTGTNSTVNSLYSRLEPREGGTMVRTNGSKSGAKAADLPGQAAAVVNRTGVDVVTILIGANDACTSTVSGMTSPTAFRGSIDMALATLRDKGIEQVAIASIPDINKLWELYKGSSSARFTWGLYRICQSLLANPLGTSQADVQRRAAVQTRVKEFNAQLALACAAAEIPCRFDGHAVFTTPFVKTDVSTADYFHPSRYGQAKLAATTYTAFGF
ncbi:MAG: GDSL-type esterase/lipase family protein [Candidatus Nanopelagicales bacterium]|nr:GDSL-type esterase/lipase family protein [Candidatus Nanopelagicales bacterium]